MKTISFAVCVVVVCIGLLSLSKSHYHDSEALCRLYRTTRAVKCREVICSEGEQCELTVEQKTICWQVNDITRYRTEVIGSGCELKKYKLFCNVDCDARYRNRVKKPICGRNGILYASLCHLRKTECLQGSIGADDLEKCESLEILQSPADTAVHLDYMCVEQTVNELDVNQLVIHNKLEKILKESLSTYWTWKHNSITLDLPLYNALSILHATEILLKEGKLAIEWGDIVTGDIIGNLHRGVAASALPRFHTAVDSCQSDFLRHSAVLNAVRVLNTTYIPVFRYSPWMDESCLISLTVTLPCEVVSNIGSTVQTRWLFHHRAFFPSLSRRHIVSKDGSLTIVGVNTDDLGRYTCKAISSTQAKTSVSAVLSADKCPCLLKNLQVHDRAIKNRALDCFSAESVKVSRMTMISILVNEVILSNGRVEDVFMDNINIKKLIVSNLDSVQRVVVKNSEIEVMELSGFSGVQIELHNVQIRELKLRSVTLTNGGFIHCNISNGQFLSSQLSDFNIRNTYIGGLDIRTSSITNTSMYNTSLVGLVLQNSFVSGLVSDNVSYWDNYLYGLRVEHSLFTNSDLRNYTTIGSHRRNLSTINMTVSDMHSFDATLIDDFTVNAVYKNLVVGNITVRNSTSYNSTFVSTDFKNSTFESSTWHDALFANSTLYGSSFDQLLLNTSFLRNLSVLATNFTNTQVFNLDGDKALFQDIQLRNYTTVNATRTNMVTQNMLAIEMTSLNALIINETTTDAVYMNLVARKMQSRNCSSSFVNYSQSYFYDSNFSLVFIEHGFFNQLKVVGGSHQNMTVLDSKVSDTSFHEMVGSNAVYKDVEFHNHTTVGSTRVNTVTNRMKAFGFYSLNAVIINETTSNSHYYGLKAVNTTARNCRMNDVSYSTSSFVRGNLTNILVDGGDFRSVSVDQTLLVDININSTVVKNISVSYTNFTNTILLQLVGQDAMFTEIHLKNYTTVNSVRKNMITQGMRATKFYSLNTTIVNETTIDAQYSELKAYNTTVRNSRCTTVLYSDSLFSGAVMKHVQFVSTVLLNSSLLHTSFVNLSLDKCSLKQLGVVDSNFSDSVNHNLVGEFANFTRIRMTNYTTVNATRRNMVTTDMTVEGFQSVNASITNESTFDSDYNGLVAINVTAVNSTSTNVSYRNSVFTNSFFSNISVHNSIVRNTVFNEFSTIDCSLVNVSHTNATFTKCVMKNHGVFESVYIQSKFFNVTLASYVESRNEYHDVVTNHVTYKDSELSNSFVKNWKSSNDVWIHHKEDEMAYNNVSLEDGHISKARFSNLTATEYDLVNVRQTNVTYRDVVTSDHRNVNCTFNDCTFVNMNLTNYVDINGVYNDIITSDVVSMESVQSGTTVRNWYSVRELCNECKDNSVAYYNISMIDAVYRNNSWNEVSILGWSIKTAEFVHGMYSNLTIHDWYSLNACWEYNTGYDVALLNVMSVGTQIANNLICGGRFVNYTGIDQNLVDYQAYGLTTVTAFYQNLTKTRYQFTDSSFVNTEYLNLHITDGAYYNVLVNKQTIRNTRERNITTINMTAIEFSSSDGVVSNNVFQNVTFTNSTQRRLTVKNEIWNDVAFATTVYSDMHFTNITALNNVTFFLVKVHNSDYHDFAVYSLELAQCSFKNVSMNDFLFYSLKISRSDFVLHKFASGMFNALDIRHSVVQQVLFQNTTIAGMDSYNSTWVGVVVTMSRLACPMFNEGVIVDFEIRQSLLTHAQFLNHDEEQIKIYQSVVDTAIWSGVISQGIRLHDVNSTDIKLQNTVFSEMTATDVTMQSLQLQSSNLTVSHSVNFEAKTVVLWKCELPQGIVADAVVKKPILSDVSRPCHMSYSSGYVTQFRFGQCGSDAVGELTCSTGHMITNIGSADMIQSEDEPDCIPIVIALVNQMCDLKHYCLVPAEAINRNCQLLSGCFQVDYACKSIDQVIDESLNSVFNQDSRPVSLLNTADSLDFSSSTSRCFSRI
ncbi:uncharacterized protein LOC134181204 isoform X2 [Corticium candelabrum]|nr:uncharacterized protein LOC134181204 isoform X2 [Corticium candelabrum]XP_062504437.1 uncharacterized protein LOC134181204 isoform X2 [Corticium candelabrum]